MSMNDFELTSKLLEFLRLTILIDTLLYFEAMTMGTGEISSFL